MYYVRNTYGGLLCVFCTPNSFLSFLYKILQEYKSHRKSLADVCVRACVCACVSIHSCRMDLPTIISKRLFPNLGVFVDIFHFYSNRTFCNKQWRRQIWFCTVCLCPTEMTLGFYGIIIVY